MAPGGAGATAAARASVAVATVCILLAVHVAAAAAAAGDCESCMQQLRCPTSCSCEAWCRHRGPECELCMELEGLCLIRCSQDQHLRKPRPPSAVPA